MLTQALKFLAKRWLGLVEPCSSTAVALADERGKELDLVRETNQVLNGTISSLRGQMKRMHEKYPSVWLNGDVAQGVVQLPKLKIAVEFFREENKLCVVIPTDKAYGHKPTEFLPPFLEKDPDLEVEGAADKMNGKVWVYKIPILGWNDALEMTKNVEDEQPNYELDGTIREKQKTFRSRGRLNGIMRRNQVNGRTFFHLWFPEADIPKPDSYPIEKLLPQGNFKFVDASGPEHLAGGLLYWNVRVEEVPAEGVEESAKRLGGA